MALPSPAWPLKMRDEGLPDFERAMFCLGWLQDIRGEVTTASIAKTLGWDEGRADVALLECRSRGLLSD